MDETSPSIRELVRPGTTVWIARPGLMRVEVEASVVSIHHDLRGFFGQFDSSRDYRLREHIAISLGAIGVMIHLVKADRNLGVLWCNDGYLDIHGNELLFMPRT